MEHSEEPRTEVGERRKGERKAARGSLTIHVTAQDLAGEIENLSSTGVLFFTQNALAVTVDIEQQGRVERRTGRLIRAQRMQGDTIGWALEFDDRGEG